jgi:hypothetical protein
MQIRQRNILKLSMRNERLHGISNDNGVRVVNVVT